MSVQRKGPFACAFRVIKLCQSSKLATATAGPWYGVHVLQGCENRRLKPCLPEAENLLLQESTRTPESASSSGACVDYVSTIPAARLEEENKEVFITVGTPQTCGGSSTGEVNIKHSTHYSHQRSPQGSLPSFISWRDTELISAAIHSWHHLPSGQSRSRLACCTYLNPGPQAGTLSHTLKE